MIKLIINLIKHFFPEKTQCLAYKLLYKDQLNVNIDLCDKNQKRVLISYITLTGFDFSKAQHASYYHLNQILHYFIQKNYCVDLCRLDDLGAYERLKDNKYDFIFGSGPVYKLFCKNNIIPTRICFITENNPIIVKQKYQERLEYFEKRHPNLNHNLSKSRNGYYDEEMFLLSTSAILMNSTYNAKSFNAYFNDLYLINSNAIYNENYTFNEIQIRRSINESKSNVLWFGSLGLIHKGLDLLIDAVGDFPGLKLNCYGVAVEEKQLFHKLKRSNTVDCGRVNVLSEEFITNVILKHNYVFLPSCSEGMSTAVATCMAHGLIPIITKECGFNDSPLIVQIDDFSIKNIKNVISIMMNLSIDEILEKRRECYNYARKEFSLAHFNNSFNKIMDSITLKSK